MNVVTPVSYTHLDVYKRQILQTATTGFLKAINSNITVLNVIWVSVNISFIVDIHHRYIRIKAYVVLSIQYYECGFPFSGGKRTLNNVFC